MGTWTVEKDIDFNLLCTSSSSDNKKIKKVLFTDDRDILNLGIVNLVFI